jgi:outer membrane lipoprotein carrier protein
VCYGKHVLTRTLSVVIVALALLWGGQADAAERAVDVAAQVERFYRGTRTFKARFKQVSRLKVQNVRKIASGRVAYARRGKLSLRYDDPKGNRVVSDGKRVKVYERKRRQLYSSKVKRSPYPAMLAFLSGQRNLTRHFAVRLIDTPRAVSEKARVLEAVPNKPSPAYAKLVLYVDARSGQVRRVLVMDAQGNYNRFDFSNVVTNKKIPASEFRFRPPAGTKVIKP